MRPVQAKAINYLRPDIDPNTRLYVPFNEGLGSIAKDYSQYGNHAVLTDVEWGIGVNGNAGVFNGVSSFANCGNHPSLNITDAITTSARVKPVETTKITISKGTFKSDGWYLWVRPNGVLRFVVNDASSTDELESNIGAYTLSQWNHVVIVWLQSTKTASFYVNGVGKGSDTTTLTLTVDDTNLFIGAYLAQGHHFNGTIDEVMIYNLELSAAQNAADCYEVVCNA